MLLLLKDFNVVVPDTISRLLLLYMYSLISNRLSKMLILDLYFAG